MAHGPFTFFLIEDDSREAELFTLALAERAADVELVHAPDASFALAWLERHRRVLPPMVILLDLNLDGQDGHVLLGQLKAAPVFQLLPVIILTNSDNPEDMKKAYQLRANGYLVKPSNPEEYRELVSVLTRYWHGVVQLPT